ncbi:MAG: amidohydrolase family protein [Myxococcota bacterium]|nr:amidohydrolase family protein [Myxococcota bacterium]
MAHPITTILSLLLLTIVALPMPALGTTREAVHVFDGGRIIPVDRPEIEVGTLVIKDGRVLSVGPKGVVKIPDNAVIHDMKGKVLMPGLVCTHTHIGSPWAADRSGPIQPEVRALDGLNVRDAGFQKAQAGGITTVNAMPGSGHLISGQTVYLKLRDGRVLDDLLIPRADGKPAGGMKMANGTNSMKKPPFPGTRANSAALVRAAFTRAQEYGEKKKKGARNLAMEALLEVLDGTRVVHHHTHRHDDILTVLRLSKEFGFRVVLHHASDAWKVADEIAASKAPVSLIMVDSPGGKLEAMDITIENGAALEKAGALVGFHTDDPITDSRLFLRSAALAVRAGMSREKAIYGLTLAGAKMLDLDKRIGSLSPGKDADVVVLSGDPLSTYTQVEQTWVEGALVFDRSRPQDRLWATGGYGASRPQTFHMCCYGDGE